MWLLDIDIINTIHRLSSSWIFIYIGKVNTKGKICYENLVIYSEIGHYPFTLYPFTPYPSTLYPFYLVPDNDGKILDISLLSIDLGPTSFTQLTTLMMSGICVKANCMNKVIYTKNDAIDDIVIFKQSCKNAVAVKFSYFFTFLHIIFCNFIFYLSPTPQRSSLYESDKQ